MSDLKDLTIDELLELAEDAVEDKVEERKPKPHVVEFIKEYKLVPGLTLIPGYLIYFNYNRKWRTESRSKLSKIEFFRNFNRFFEQKRKTNMRYYLLNENSFELSNIYLQEAKDSDKRYEQKIKKNKKKPKQVSKPRKEIHS